ncbi:MAG: acetyl-CoA carboxylase carboxyltransferase subunit beta, partial [Atopobiaceae bacterium]
MTDERHAKSANELEGPVTEVPVELPERHVLVRCPGCRRAVDAAELASALDVCPRCGTHLRIGARRRIEITVDDGSFEEWDEGLEAVDLLGFPDYPAKLEAAREKSGELDGVITGRASIGGEACALFVMNGDFMMGSMGSAVGERICRAFERATEEGLPVVGFAVSGGARMQEGTTSLMQMAKVSAAVRRHGEEGLAYLVVLTDPTSGGVTASFAMEADVCLAEPGAL